MQICCQHGLLVKGEKKKQGVARDLVQHNDWQPFAISSVTVYGFPGLDRTV